MDLPEVAKRFEVSTPHWKDSARGWKPTRGATG
jgi:hypothetical protein